MDLDWLASYRSGATTTAFAGKPPPSLAEDQTTKLAALIDKFAHAEYALPPKDGAVEEKEKYGTGLTDEEKMFLSREQLLRFLTADKFVLPTAIARTEKCLQWRRSIGMYDVDLMAREVEREFSETLGQIVYGWSKDGSPCIIMVPSRRATPPSALGLTHLFFLLERAADLMPAGISHVCFAIDMGGKRKYSTPLGHAKEFISVLGAHYPERLGKGMMVNVPTVIRFFLNAIWPLIDPLTKAKIAWPLSTSPGGAPGSISAIIPPSNLSTDLGGEVEIVPSREAHDWYWSALLTVSKERREAYRVRWMDLGSKVGESELVCKMAGVAEENGMRSSTPVA